MVRRGENRQGLRGMRRHVESYVLWKEVSLLREEELRSSGDLGLMTSESLGADQQASALNLLKRRNFPPGDVAKAGR